MEIIARISKIALCKDCHGYYDDHKTKEEYLKLIGIKRKILIAAKVKISTSHQDLEDEIVIVINSLSDIDYSFLEKMKLEYQALRISSKIEERYFMLKMKIETMFACIIISSRRLSKIWISQNKLTLN